jgi:CubicO group peptidase (beta-lactamase class C family)
VCLDRLPHRWDSKRHFWNLPQGATGAAAALRLAQDGRLDLDATLAEYLPELEADVAGAGSATVRQLLQHRACFGDHLAHPRFRESPQQLRTVADYMELVRDGRDAATTDRWPPVASPAGGSHATAGDLHAFVSALMAVRLLEARWTDTLLRGCPDDEPSTERGRGTWRGRAAPPASTHT